VAKKVNKVKSTDKVKRKVNVKPKEPTLVNVKDVGQHDRYQDVYTDVSPNEAVSIRAKDNWAHIESKNNVHLKIEFLTDTMIRVRYAYRAFEDDFSYAIDKSFEKTVNSKTTEDQNTSFLIGGKKLSCKISKKDMSLSFYNENGKLINQDAGPCVFRSTIHKGFIKAELKKKSIKSEAFYGLGDKASHLELRGQKVVNWNTDAFSYGAKTDPLYKTIPFYYGLKSGDGYGLFYDNSYKSHFDFDSDSKGEVTYHAEGGEINYYFIYGPQLISVAEQYAKLTGVPELPPMWALGFHQCRWSYYPEQRFISVAEEFRKRKIPCDSVYLDIDYMEGFRCFTVSQKLFPNLKKAIKKVKKLGFDTVVMIDPGIKAEEGYFVYDQGLKEGFFCKRTDGKLMLGPVWPDVCAFPDFTKKKVRKWFGALYEELYNDFGVSGFWNDMNEPAVFKVKSCTFPDEVLHHYEGHGGNHRKAHNIYGMQMVNSTQKGLKKLNKKKRPFVLTRATYSGGQRYSSVWTGDNVATWEHLQISNTQVQRLSVSGYSFSGCDIGGFVDQPTPELMTRWLQLGVFHPFYRIHSIGNREDGSAGIAEAEELNEKDRMDQEPWAYGEKATQLNRMAIELRYQLLPYIYSTFEKHISDGTPMTRSMIFEDQSNRAFKKEERDFMFGRDLLVSPVIRAKAKTQSINLPRGNWYDLHSGEHIENKRSITVKLEEDKIPVFAKAGSVIPFHPVRQHTKESLTDITFKIFTSEDSSIAYHYEDKGEGYGYAKKKYLKLYFDFIGKQNRFDCNIKSKGKYKMPYNEYKFEIIGLEFEPKVLLIDGKKSVSQYDAEKKVLYIKSDKMISKMRVY
jgi:alpha-glucosidase